MMDSISSLFSQERSAYLPFDYCSVHTKQTKMENGIRINPWMLCLLTSGIVAPFS